MSRRAAPHPLVLALAGTAFLALVGCEPGDRRAGAWLSGEQINTPVTDWAVTNAFQDCFIETATWYAIPHSVKLWCAEHAGDVYVGSYGEGSRTWEKHVVRNGDGALRVDGKIYGGRFELVKDPKLTEGIVQSYTEKYSSNELWEVTLTEDGLPPDWRFYRLSQGG